jgi:hypothetical protein
MAKRGRGISLDGLVSRLSQIDAERRAILAQLQGALASTLRTVEGVAGIGPKRGRPPGSKNNTAGAKKGRRKMSAAARKAISDAQKKRWAKQKAASK